MLGVSIVGRSIELVAATLWDLGLDLLGLYETLIALARVLTALALSTCSFFRPLLCFLAKHVCLRNLGSTPLRESYLRDRGFSIVFLCHFSGLVARGVLFGFGHICTQAHSSRSAWDQKRKSCLLILERQEGREGRGGRQGEKHQCERETSISYLL